MLSSLSSSSRFSSGLWARASRAALSAVAKRAERPTVIKVGDFVEVKRTYTEEEMKIFAELSGDFNPLHTDIDFAKSTRFGRPIVFGVLMNGCVPRADHQRGKKEREKRKKGEEKGKAAAAEGMLEGWNQTPRGGGVEWLSGLTYSVKTLLQPQRESIAKKRGHFIIICSALSLLSPKIPLPLRRRSIVIIKRAQVVLKCLAQTFDNLVARGHVGGRHEKFPGRAELAAEPSKC
jgi:hypothetical protein